MKFRQNIYDTKLRAAVIDGPHNEDIVYEYTCAVDHAVGICANHSGDVCEKVPAAVCIIHKCPHNLCKLKVPATI